MKSGFSPVQLYARLVAYVPRRQGLNRLPSSMTTTGTKQAPHDFGQPQYISAYRVNIRELLEKLHIRRRDDARDDGGKVTRQRIRAAGSPSTFSPLPFSSGWVGRFYIEDGIKTFRLTPWGPVGPLKTAARNTNRLFLRGTILRIIIERNGTIWCRLGIARQI